MKDKVYCAVDVGGTKTLLMLIGAGRRVLFRERFATPARSLPGEMVQAVNRSAEAALAKANLSPRSLAGLGICIASLLDYDKGLIHQAPNLGWYGPVPLKQLFKESWTCPVFLDNDANAAVLGEVRYGAARGHRNAVYITVSTGIGGGFYLDGKIYRGSAGFAGEIGHTKIKPFGESRRCGCGGMDCLETWASGTAVAHSARELWDDRDVSGGPISTAWVFDQAQAGNPLARTIVEQAVLAVGTGLANLVTLLNPSCLVIGGGVVGSRSDLLEQISAQVHRIAIAPSVNVSPVKVTAAELEPEAGIWGMYALMLEELEQA